MDPDRAHLVASFNTTNREKRTGPLAAGIPNYGADPKFFPRWEQRAGVPQNFMDEDVPYPLGREDRLQQEDLVEAIAQCGVNPPSLRSDR